MRSRYWSPAYRREPRRRPASALERRQNVLAQIIPILEQGHTEGKTGIGPPVLTAEGIVGGVLSVLHARLTEKTPTACWTSSVR